MQIGSRLVVAAELECVLEIPLGRGSGAERPGVLGRTHERQPGAVAYFRSVGGGGVRVVRVHQVGGDDLGDLLLLSPRTRQIRGRREVTQLALPAGQCSVSHAADQVLHEDVLAALWRTRVRLDREEVLTDQRRQTASTSASLMLVTALNAGTVND